MAFFIFTATRNSTANVNIPLLLSFTVGGSAVFEIDYTVSGATTYTTTSGSLILPIGSSSASFTATTIANTLDQPDRTIILTPQPDNNLWEVAASNWSVTIIDDDEPISLPTINIFVSPNTQIEGSPTNGGGYGGGYN